VNNGVCAGECRSTGVAAMFVDAARAHPGCSWRASVLTGLALEIGPDLENPLRLGPRTVFLRSGAVASGVP
jgi:hypothetical protein